MRHDESVDLKSTMNRRVYRDHLKLMHFIDLQVLIITQLVLSQLKEYFRIYVAVFKNVRDQNVTRRNEIDAFPGQTIETFRPYQEQYGPRNPYLL